jgi:hypothetical protein
VFLNESREISIDTSSLELKGMCCYLFNVTKITHDISKEALIEPVIMDNSVSFLFSKI